MGYWKWFFSLIHKETTGLFLINFGLSWTSISIIEAIMITKWDWFNLIASPFIITYGYYLMRVKQ